MSKPKTAIAKGPAAWEKALLIAEASPERLPSTEFSATVVTAGTRIESPILKTTAAGKLV